VRLQAADSRAHSAFYLPLGSIPEGPLGARRGSWPASTSRAARQARAAPQRGCTHPSSPARSDLPLIHRVEGAERRIEWERAPQGDHARRPSDGSSIPTGTTTAPSLSPWQRPRCPPSPLSVGPASARRSHSARRSSSRSVACMQSEGGGCGGTKGSRLRDDGGTPRRGATAEGSDPARPRPSRGAAAAGGARNGGVTSSRSAWSLR